MISRTRRGNIVLRKYDGDADKERLRRCKTGVVVHMMNCTVRLSGFLFLFTLYCFHSYEKCLSRC